MIVVIKNVGSLLNKDLFYIQNVGFVKYFFMVIKVC